LLGGNVIYVLLIPAWQRAACSAGREYFCGKKMTIFLGSQKKVTGTVVIIKTKKQYVFMLLSGIINNIG
jgi:hypothetical protein